MFNSILLKLQNLYEGNSLEDYLIAITVMAGVFLVTFFFDKYVVWILKKSAEKSVNKYDDVIAEFLKGIHWQFYTYLGIYIGSLFLNLPSEVSSFLWYLLLVFIGYYIVRGLFKIVDFFVTEEYKKREKKQQGGSSMIWVLGVIVKFIIGIIIILTVLSNFGVSITPLITGVGIGGIALALAAQAILGDLFSAFTIYFDKPFKEGDFLILGNDMGIVKYIGIKSTRIQTLEGQELVVSNSELTNTRINNYGKMQKRRDIINFGVTYSTPENKLKKINKIVEDIIKNTKGAELDRIHFKKFGDSSLVYELVYYVNSSDYYQYMDTKEKINLALKQRLEKINVEFAFPTQTIYYKKEK